MRPQNVYVSLTQLKLGTFDAVAYFNVGRKISFDIFKAIKYWGITQAP